MSDHTRLDGGLVLRTATPADLEQIVALSLAAHGDDEERGLRMFFADPRVGPSRWTVVVDGERVVSTLGLGSATARVQGLDVPAGWVEYVATDPAYQRRGLVRAQMDRVHTWSAQRGDLLQIIQGIYYFYRRFGYAYALRSAERVQLRRGAKAAVPDGWSVRAADAGDLDAVAALDARASAVADLSLVRSRDEWRAVLDGIHPQERSWVAVHDDRVRGYARTRARDDLRQLYEVAVDGLDAARALAGHAAADGDRAGVALCRRPGTPWDALLDDIAVAFEPSPSTDYARIADPVAFLAHLRPVLSERLAASPWAGDRGSLRVTTYVGGFRIDYAGGAVTAVEPAAPLEEPDDQNVGVPPDVLPQLLLGARYPRELERWHDDVVLGQQAGLVAALFPKLTHDAWFWF
ncbi:MAG: GNAT family N-acetyltransferase [Euzebyales bacterium]|nr:GNAT family N-acetyltransferase [Euzebyales bacterium]